MTTTEKPVWRETLRRLTRPRITQESGGTVVLALALPVLAAAAVLATGTTGAALLTLVGVAVVEFAIAYLAVYLRVREEPPAEPVKVPTTPLDFALLDLDAAEDALDAADAPRLVRSFGGVTLYDTGFEDPEGFYDLTPTTTARVDTAGNLAAYSTAHTRAGRVAVGFVLGGGVGALVGASAKKSAHHTLDTRELYLLVESERWARTIPVNPDLGAPTRELAQAIVITARDLPHALRRREKEIRVAERRVRECRAAVERLRGADPEIEPSS